MKYSIFAVSVIFSIALSLGSASADFDTDKKNCRINIFDPRANFVIPACTNLIVSGRFSGQRLARLYEIRGMTYQFSDQYDKAIEDFDQVIGLTPDRDFIYFLRGRSYESLGNPDQARKNYKKSYDLGGRTEKLLKKLQKYDILP